MPHACTTCSPPRERRELSHLSCLCRIAPLHAHPRSRCLQLLPLVCGTACEHSRARGDGNSASPTLGEPTGGQQPQAACAARDKVQIAHAGRIGLCHPRHACKARHEVWHAEAHHCLGLRRRQDAVQGRSNGRVDAPERQGCLCPHRTCQAPFANQLWIWRWVHCFGEYPH
eukprot:5775584-Prymnesium_polylepis.2